jgi:hypothetical protein
LLRLPRKEKVAHSSFGFEWEVKRPLTEKIAERHKLPSFSAFLDSP